MARSCILAPTLGISRGFVQYISRRRLRTVSLSLRSADTPLVVAHTVIRKNTNHISRPIRIVMQDNFYSALYSLIDWKKFACHIEIYRVQLHIEMARYRYGQVFLQAGLCILKHAGLVGFNQLARYNLLPITLIDSRGKPKKPACQSA